MSYKATYEIRRKLYDDKHKCMFLLSVVQTLTGTAAMWSAHKVSNDTTLDNLKHFFQRSHDRQIEKMISDEYLKEPPEFKSKTAEMIDIKKIETEQLLNGNGHQV